LRLRYLKETLRLFLLAGAELPSSQREKHKTICGLIKTALAKDSSAALEFFSSPDIGAPIHCFANRELWPDLSPKILAAFPDVMPRLLAEMGHRRLAPLALPLEGEIHFALTDTNPISETEAHPQKSGSGINMGGHSHAQWQSRSKRRFG